MKWARPTIRIGIEIGLFFLLMGLLPLIARIGIDCTDKPVPSSGASIVPQAASDFFTIYDEGTGRTLTVPDSEFLYGAVVCEMPLTYHAEALKAQAVAAYTVYDYQRAQRRAAGKSGADFTCNTKTWLLYTTEEDMRARWGEAYPEYRAKMEDLFAGLAGQRLVCDGERVLSTYYAISAGVTEASADVWGGALDYLIPVDSSWDQSAEGYCTDLWLTPAEFQSALEPQCTAGPFTGAPDQWIGPVTRTHSGTVREITIGGQSFTGEALRLQFGLRSANFDLTFTDTQFHFAVRGYGHGVGMSQYGANHLAGIGLGYEEILSHYYPGTTLFFG